MVAVGSRATGIRLMGARVVRDLRAARVGHRRVSAGARPRRAFSARLGAPVPAARWLRGRPAFSSQSAHAGAARRAAP